MSVKPERAVKKSPERTIVVTGGGTGGHLFPALAVAEAIRKENPGVELIYISREHERDRREVEKRNIPFVGFPLEGLRRKLTVSNLRALWKFFAAFLQCRRMMKRLPKGVVFGVGGYVSAPAMAAGKTAGWIVTLHEQNTVPGLVNRLMAPRCDRVFVTYESTLAYWKKAACTATGLPLRSDQLEARQNRGACQDRTSPTVLLIGGSQGARKVVEIGLQALSEINKRGVAFRALVQTGERNYEWASSLPRPEGVELTPFIDDMASAYQEADVVISRAGSGSLSEIALWELPSILIPYPFASENHQVANAQTFVDAGATRAIEEKDLTQQSLTEPLLELLQSPERRAAMTKGAASLARKDAAQTIANELLRLLDAIERTVD